MNINGMVRPVWGSASSGMVEHLVLEAERNPGIEIYGQVQVERASACLLGVEIDLPGLAHRVGLDEVTLVVDVELMVRRVLFDVGDEAGNVDDCHVQISHAKTTRCCSTVLGFYGARSGSEPRVQRVDRYQLLALFDDLVAEVVDGLSELADWGLSGLRPGQYNHDLVADDIIVRRLLAEGLAVLSEESGLVGDGEITVVVDPVDGSTNGARALPWYATSLCAVDADGPLAAEVVNLATGDRFRAIRGEGVESDEVDIAPTGCTSLGDAIIAFSGLPPSHGGWRQFRVYGAAALDLCAVATAPSTATSMSTGPMAFGTTSARH